VALSAEERARYARHLALPEIAAEGQERLKAARVLVIGAGGLGSPSALYLAAAGVGTLGLVDCDRVDLSNLQRQVLFDNAALQRPKAVVARERLLSLNPGIRVVAHELTLRAGNVREVIDAYDIVLDGTDRLPTRYLVNDACVLLGKPLVTAAIHRFEGQAMTYVPGCGPCYRCLFPETPAAVVPSCAEAGVLGVLPGVMGAIQATEAIKLIVGRGAPLVGRLLTYDALELRFQEFRFARRADCAVCGERPTITELRDSPEACMTDALQSLRRIAPSELQMMLADTEGGEALMLVDVREPREFAAGHLLGAINMPMSELDRRLAELPAGSTAVFMCRSGGRSLRACGQALRGGTVTPLQLEGGLLAWAAEVDPALIVAPAG
jgi:molybdopterin/thiamine biosynthesis adenylyltransferase/rhodanese-related sulfurtransferase